LKSSLDKDDPYFAKFKDFWDNKNKYKTNELITNVSWTAWLNLINNLWEDIWNYEILLKWLWSHSIVETVNYIDKLSEDSKELERKRTKEAQDWDTLQDN